MTNNLKKKELRNFFSEKREILKKSAIDSDLKIVKNIIGIKEFHTAKNIATFISIKSEISTEHLNNYLISVGKNICLPVILKNQDHLIFRNFNKHTILKKGKYGVLEPTEESRLVIPDIVLTPCLAFDLYGNRLGYGGGYYDKTFSFLKKSKYSITSICIAFDDQKSEKLVIDQYDEKIDYILTEKKIYIAK